MHVATAGGIITRHVEICGYIIKTLHGHLAQDRSIGLHGNNIQTYCVAKLKAIKEKDAKHINHYALPKCHREQYKIEITRNGKILRCAPVLFIFRIPHRPQSSCGVSVDCPL